jgi:Tol biopolymer transport system component
MNDSKRMSHFEILGDLGRGGMGVVLRARDTRLGREVALKTLPPELSRDPDRVERFRREALVLASLNHPNIATIFGVEDSEQGPLLVMELVGGTSLAERLEAGPLPLSAALDVAGQIVEALDAAHAQGVIHRDLKPANIHLDSANRVKVLDFGLAKVLSAEPDSGDETRTLGSAQLTVDGAVLGTPSYMSPEQARGEPADERSDLWAFGCVFFEMLTGRQAFPGTSYAEIVASVLAREPRWSDLPEGVPEGVRRLLISCLAKAAGDRVRSTRDIRDELGRARAWLEAASGPAVTALPRLTQLTWSEGVEESPAFSPDGADLLFTRQAGGVRKVFRLRLATGESFPVTRGDRDDIQPIWHPSGESILFVRGRVRGRMLEPGDVFGQFGGTSENAADVWEQDLETGAERMLVEDAFNPSLSPDGTLIAVDARWAGPHRIWTVDVRGRNPRQVTTDTSEAVAHVRPQWSPDGRILVFQNIERTRFDIRTVHLGSGELHWLTRDSVLDVHPVFAPDGRVYFTSYRSGGMNLWRVPVDGEGAPVGALRQVTTGAGQDVEAAFSPDGKRLAFCILRQNADVWRLPVSPETGLANGDPESVIASTRESSRGAWSPDDRAVAFNSNRSGEMNLWLYRFDGDALEQLTRGPGGDFQPSWCPDGRSLAFFSARNGNPGIWTLDLESRELRCLSPEERVEVNPFYSPDGASIAYHSDRDGRLEVWVMDADGGNPRQVTRVGVMGHFLRWTRDGSHIVFRRSTGDQTVHVVPSGGGEPVALPHVRGGSHLSLNPDGTRIMDVMAHKVLWVSRVEGGEPEQVYEFPDPDSRIDYPVWSNDGRWVLFDRFRPKGGDIWMLEGMG